MMRISGTNYGKPFCAGIEPGGLCAPILYWMKRKGWGAFQIQQYCRGKGWECDEL